MIKELLKRPIGVTMSVVAIVVLSIVAMGYLPVSLMPAIDIPQITIQVSAPGLSVREVDNTLLKPLKNQLSQVTGLKNITAEARADAGAIYMDFEPNSNVDIIFIDVNEKLDRAVATLPKDIERPKVIYNEKTKKFVMWFHLELKGKGYAAARAGVAVSDSPAGPYRFVSSSRVCPGVFPLNMTDEERDIQWNMEQFEEWWTPEWREAVNKGLFVKRDLKGGQMSRDMTLYVDDDGKAYHIYSSEENLTLQIAELTDDYQGHSGKYIRLFPGGHNEAPALFKHDGTYWMITSGCTGWEPNEARLFSASSIWGPWKQHLHPFIGKGAEKTFGGQSTFVISTLENRFVFMADVWKPESLMYSKYIWLPIGFDDTGKPVIEWKESWNPC